MSVQGKIRDLYYGTYWEVHDAGRYFAHDTEANQPYGFRLSDAVTGTAATTSQEAAATVVIAKGEHFAASSEDFPLWINCLPGKTYELIQVVERHDVAATTATLDIMKCDAAEAVTSGATMLASTFNLASTAATTVVKNAQTGLASTFGATARQIATGECIGAKFSWGTAGSFAGGYVQLTLAEITNGA